MPFTSQVLQYKPYEQDIVLATPKNLKIVSSNIIKKDNEHENLFLSLKWDIDNQRVIENLIKQNKNGKDFSIDYLFFKGDKPTELKDKLLGLKITFKGNKTDLNSIEYSLLQDSPIKNTSISLIKDKSSTTTRVEVINNKPTTILEANVTFKIPVSAKDSNNKLFFEYPGTYFLATKGEYEINTGNDTLSHKTDLSLPVTLTLDGIQNIPVPTPQNLKIVKDSVSKNSFSIEYDPLKYKNEDDLLYEYNEIMLKTIDRELRDESINYDFYITQDKSLFDEIVKLKKDDEIPSNIQSKITEHKLTEEMTENGISIDFKSSLGSEQLVDILRSKGIVKISDIKQKIDLPKQKLNFLGLDENETYYVMGKTIITPYEKQPTVPMPQPPPILPFNQNKNLQDNAIINVANNSSTIKKDSSTFSKILTVTTIDPQSPSENEKIPPAPTKFIAENITLNSVELVWDRVKDSFPEVSEDGKEKSTLEYQFLKTRGEQLPDSFLKSKDSFEKTWQSLDKIKNKAGIKTDKNNIFEFDDSTKSFSTTAAVKEKYEYIQWEGSEGRIADKTLSPNQIYFYYIRTVRTSEKDGEVYSVWVPLSFTTKNTEGPKNLRVEPKEEYNKKSEVVISFDIPKMDINSIGQEYDLQYSIKEDLGKWSKDITMDKAKLSFKENDDGKTIKVKYKISGLKSGKMYTIRVRMVNKPLNAPSVYSNEVEHRTSSDNNDNDYDENVNNWEINFKDLIEKLKNESYWFAQNNSSNTVVYYRPQYFDKVISSTNNSIIDLALGKGGSYKQYYLPASAIIKAFEQNKGFKISFNNADVIFSAKTINPDDHEIIKKISEEIKSKNSSISDYFIKLSVDFNSNKYIINGSDSISPLAKINVSVIGTKNKIIDLDQKMLDYIEELLKSKEFSEDVKSKIQELVKDKADNKIMVQEIAKLVDRFKLNFGDKLNKSLYNIEEKIYDLKYLTNDIIFAYPAQQGISINGYKKAENRWIGISAKDYLGKKAIYTRETGEYIFTGKKLVINGLSNLQNSNQITNIVIKYNLDDFLGKNGNINLKAPISKHSVIGSLSRVAGANNTQDPVEFFKTKDIIISTRNMDKNITPEEAVYLIMKVYEMKTKTKLETIKIKNYSLTKDIKNVNNNYKKPIQVAFQTGIYNNPNMNAKGTISVQEFLQSLANMSTMIGI